MAVGEGNKYSALWTSRGGKSSCTMLSKYDRAECIMHVQHRGSPKPGVPPDREQG